VRASEHAPRGPLRVFERRHCLAKVVERGVGGDDVDAYAIWLTAMISMYGIGPTRRGKSLSPHHDIDARSTQAIPWDTPP